jgi:hypothetical protein
LNFIGTGLTPVNSESSDDLVPYIVKNTLGHRAGMFPAGLRTRILKLVFLFLVSSLYYKFDLFILDFLARLGWDFFGGVYPGRV